MIEAVGLTKRYGRTLAVNNLSFTVEPGRVTGFLGPNGAGKSTTMRMILGLDNPDSGHVHIDGKPYRQLHKPLYTVGALLDARWVHANRTAHAHLRWLARSNGIPAKRVDEVLEIVGLTSVAKRRAGTFSLGMFQRLGIAAALLGDPRVLLFDEPVNGLDPEGILWIRQFMHSLADQGRTVLVSSHLLSEMALTAHALIVIGKGQLITQASTADFIKRAGDSAVRVRTPQVEELRRALAGQSITANLDPTTPNTLIATGTSTEAVGDVAAANGLTLHELTAQTGSLEQAFMKLTGDSVEYHANLAPGELPGAAGADDLTTVGK